MDNDTAVKIGGENPEYGIQSLFEAIENKKYPSWTVYVVCSPCICMMRAVAELANL